MTIEVKKLTKKYGKQKALNNISFKIKKNEIVGLLGPNGAGKSTLLKILSGYLSFDKGRILIEGYNLNYKKLKISKLLGYLPEKNPLYEDFYVKEYLWHIGKIYRLSKIKNRIEKLIEMTGIQKEQHKKIKSLSKGYKQRVGLAQALMHDPKILILDEPTAGMDPNQIIEIRQLINQIRKDKIIILSSHNLNEVKAICDRVIIINNGKIVNDLQSVFKSTDELEKTFYSLTK